MTLKNQSCTLTAVTPLITSVSDFLTQFVTVNIRYLFQMKLGFISGDTWVHWTANSGAQEAHAVSFQGITDGLVLCLVWGLWILYFLFIWHYYNYCSWYEFSNASKRICNLL